MRDEFPKTTIEMLAKRVGNRCSNPGCRKRTSGPHSSDHKALNVGVAAHITAASPGGPRYESSLTEEKRKGIRNGIWLCQSCAKLVDNDEARYNKELILQWKHEAEQETLREIESTQLLPKEETQSVVEQPFRSKDLASQESQVDLQDHLCVSDAIVAEKIRDFVGRDFVFQEVDSMLTDASTNSGYLLIEGHPGIGKTAIIAKLVAERGYVHHFNNALQGVNSERAFLGNVCAQLVMREGLSYNQFSDDIYENGNFLNRILQETSNSLNGRKLVIAIDALDEVAGNHRRQGNLLFLPPNLPEGIYVVATTRPIKELSLTAENVRHFVLDSMSSENLDNIATYIEARLARPGIKKWIQDRKLNENRFVSGIREKSEGNFMYLHHVLPDIEKGVFKDRLQDLPFGLRQYYREHWRLMRAIGREVFLETHKQVICILAAAREAVSASQIAEWTLIDVATVQDIVGAWQEFLYQEHSNDGANPIRIYHASFRDFLSEEVDPGLRKYHRLIATSEVERLKAAGLYITLDDS